MTNPNEMSPSPNGKINIDELVIAVRRDEQNNVVVGFSGPVNWIALPPPIAVQLAMLLISNAQAKIHLDFPDEFVAAIVDGSRGTCREAAITRAREMLNGARDV